MEKVKTGFVCFGEVNTPREIINSKCKKAKEYLESIGIEIVYTSPVSDDPDSTDVNRALEDLSSEKYDFLTICVAGWIPSHAVISITQEFSNVPILLWGLSGYYKNDTLITTADQTGTSALRKTFLDLNYKFKYIYDVIGKKPKLEEIKL